MKKKPHKKLTAVEFMRKRRSELSDLYEKDPEKFWKKLEAIAKKYKSKFHQKATKKYKIKGNSAIAAEPKAPYGKRK